MFRVVANEQRTDRFDSKVAGSGDELNGSTDPAPSSFVPSGDLEKTNGDIGNEIRI